MNRTELIEAVEAYFVAVDAKRLEDTLSHFHTDATFTIQSAFIVCEGRDKGIREMFENFFADYDNIVHTDFEHVVDVEAQAVSSRFRVELDNRQGGHETKRSVNQWYFRDGRFERVYVWIGGDNVLGV